MRDLVSEFLEEKKGERDAEAAARARKPPRRWMSAVLAVLGIGAWFYPFPPPSEPRATSPLEKQAGVRMEVFMAVQRVRQYRAKHGRLPSLPAQAGITTAWITLDPFDTQEFEITGATDGIKVTFRSTMSDSTFFRGTRALLGGSTN